MLLWLVFIFLGLLVFLLTLFTLLYFLPVRCQAEFSPLFVKMSYLGFVFWYDSGYGFQFLGFKLAQGKNWEDFLRSFWAFHLYQKSKWFFSKIIFWHKPKVDGKKKKSWLEKEGSQAEKTTPKDGLEGFSHWFLQQKKMVRKGKFFFFSLKKNIQLHALDLEYSFFDPYFQGLAMGAQALVGGKNYKHCKVEGNFLGYNRGQVFFSIYAGKIFIDFARL